MNGSLAQTIALVAYGNAYLKTGDRKYAAISQTHSTFQSVGEVKFIGVEKGAKPKTFLNSHDWLESIRRGKGRFLGLGFAVDDSGQRPGPNDAAYAEVQFSVIIVQYDKACELWWPSWETDNQELLDAVVELSGEAPPGLKPNRKQTDPERPWSVEYQAAPADLQYYRNELPAEIVQDRKNLVEALTAIESFCQKEKLSDWAKVFRHARSLLSRPLPAGADGDLFPDVGFAPPARQLLTACEAAWVFGGMGSWNDQSFKSKKTNAQYEEVTQNLFAAVVAGAVDAANAFGREDLR